MPVLRTKQRGGLWLPLLLLIALFSSSLLWQPLPPPDRTSAALAEAKAALLARAALDDNRPGSLPCPDLITNQASLNNLPNDGRADTLTRNDCPAYVGRLPWATLDLGDLRDNQGERLWYALSKNFRDDDSAQPVHSETLGTLQIDQSTDIAAIIFSVGPPHSGQNRPSQSASDYLDEANTQATNRFSALTGKDRLLSISRQQLMEAAQQRVLRELLVCLQGHARQTGRYPWPAQWDDASAQGSHGTLFGKLPLTQPQGSLTPSLAGFLNTLEELHQALNTALPLNEMRRQVAEFQDKLVGYNAQQEAIYQASIKLYQASDQLTRELDTLQTHLQSAMSNGRISVSERNTFRTDQARVDPALNGLVSQIQASGLDPFPDQLNRLQQQILLARQNQNLGNLSTQLNDLQTLLTQAYSQNSELMLLIQTLLQNTVDWQSILPLFPASDSRFLLREQTCLQALQHLLNALSTLRYPIPAENFTWYAQQLAESTDWLSQQAILKSAQADLAQLTPHASLNDLSQSLTTLQNSLRLAVNKTSVFTANEKDSLQTQLTGLTSTLQRQGGNISLSSLNANGQEWRLRANELLTVSTRTQAELLPYAQRSNDSAVNLHFWAKMLREHSLQLTTLSRQSALSTTPNPDSTTQRSQAALTQLKLTLNALDQAIATPNNSRLQSLAKSHVQTLDTQLELLSNAQQNLQSQLFSGPATAFPMAWSSAACQAFQYTTGQTTWWYANQWSSTSFYQISAPDTTFPGKLTVNGQGHYALLTINSGPPINGQQRPAMQRSDYFEGNHLAASPAWEKRPASPNFNDQIAF